MTKRREAGSCAEALWSAVKVIGHQTLGDDASDEAARGEGIVQLARVLGIGKHVVRNMLDPDRPEQLSLDRAGLIARAFGIDILARWLAAESGGTFVPLPAPTGDLEKLTARGVRAAGESAAQVIEAQSEKSESGREFSAEEWRSLNADCRRVVETFSEVVALTEKGLRKARRDKTATAGR